MSEALRLADALERYWGAESGHDRERQAAAELRRLHAEAEELRGALDAAMWHVKYKELKAVNEELLGALEEYVNADPVDDALNPRKRKARAAIAKAGEQA